jgi:4-amino-4-deoxy-L-arabinose transferase-like glycosyltransferase
VFLWALASRQWGAVLRLIHPAVVTTFLVVALPWYVVCALRNPEFLHVFIVEHNVSRYLTTVFSHVQPFWFFVPVLLAAIAPWTALLFPLALRAIEKARTNRAWRDSPALFYACWAIFPVLFFSFSESKLPGYVLPAVPPLILLIAIALPDLLGERARSACWWVALVGGTLPVPFIFSLFWIRRLPTALGLANSKTPILLAAGAAVGSLLCIAVALSHRVRLALAAEAALATLMLVATNAAIIPKLDPYLSARAALRATPREALDTGNLSILGLNRSWQYGLNFYLDRTLLEWSPTMGTEGWVWTTEQGANTLQSKVKAATVQRISPEAWLVRLNGDREVAHDANTNAAKRD